MRRLSTRAGATLSSPPTNRKEKTEVVETLHAGIDQLKASIAKLTEDITELRQAVAELDAARTKATKFCQEEKAKNTACVYAYMSLCAYPYVHVSPRQSSFRVFQYIFCTSKMHHGTSQM